MTIITLWMLEEETPYLLSSERAGVGTALVPSVKLLNIKNAFLKDKTVIVLLVSPDWHYLMTQRGI